MMGSPRCRFWQVGDLWEAGTRPRPFRSASLTRPPPTHKDRCDRTVWFQDSGFPAFFFCFHHARLRIIVAFDVTLIWSLRKSGNRASECHARSRDPSFPVYTHNETTATSRTVNHHHSLNCRPICRHTPTSLSIYTQTCCCYPSIPKTVRTCDRCFGFEFSTISSPLTQVRPTNSPRDREHRRNFEDQRKKKKKERERKQNIGCLFNPKFSNNSF